MLTTDKISEIFCICDDFIKDFVLTKANVDDHNKMVFNEFNRNLFGKLYADKGYISQELFNSLWSEGTHIVTGIRSSMKNKLMSLYDKIMLRKRSVIETINDELKNVAMLVHSRHRCFENFLMNVLSTIAAYCFFGKKKSLYNHIFNERYIDRNFVTLQYGRRFRHTGQAGKRLGKGYREGFASSGI